MKTAPLSDKIPILDALRGLAIIGVVIVHTAQATLSIVNKNSNTSHSIFFSVLSCGKYGVELFFLLSGYLLENNYSLKKKILKKKFFINRFARIYPLWFLFFFADFLRYKFWKNHDGNYYVALKGADTGFAWLHKPLIVIFLTLTFTLFLSATLWNSVPGGWSIQAEVFHYMLYPILQKLSKKKLLYVYFSFAIFSLLVIRSSHFLTNKGLRFAVDAFIRLNLYSTIFYFILGILIRRIFAENEIVNSKVFFKTLKENVNLIFLIYLLIISLPIAFGSNLQALAFILGALLFVLLLTRFHFFYSGLQKIGIYSYFIYFMHFRILDFFCGQTLNLHQRIIAWRVSQITLFFILFSVVLLVSQVLGFFSMRLYEKPISRFLKTITKKFINN
jgi:peptidoglycan/LPS O-acetylase OafA/YrhL